MYKKRFVGVTGPAGLQGAIDTERWPLDGSVPEIEVEIDAGPKLRVPIEDLERDRGGYRLSAEALRKLEAVRRRQQRQEPEPESPAGGPGDAAPPPRPTAAATPPPPSAARQPPAVPRPGPGDPTIVPVVAEELEVSTRQIETGSVRIERTTTEREEVVDEPLFRHDVVIERVPINQFVDAPLPSRHEGKTVVIPVVEEVLVLQKRYMLVEEVRVTRRKLEVHKPQRVTLRKDEVKVERA